MKRDFTRPGISSFIKLTIILLVIGCKGEKTPSIPQDYHIKSPENILSQYNAGRPDWDSSVRTLGSIKITVSDTMILLEHLNQYDPELVYYFLQMDEKPKKIKSCKIEKAEVFYLDRHLLVNSLESKQTYLFSVKTDPVPDYLKGIEGVTAFTGYGLGARKVTIGAENGKIPFCGCVPADYPIGNCKTNEMNPVYCVSASEAGSCRVACSGQYYACCDRKK
jgi:hypothetical protein